ncbi:hypothetical protein Q5P01_019427 [Channa striata]|uniref:Uncharacterized protein n=1 Tax=Channa striata TaxID=64152 RepID=A0AA88M426_CHASR|nr:hypothetical protein Q5P01_019427 [Channa striata]
MCCFSVQTHFAEFFACNARISERTSNARSVSLREFSLQSVTLLCASCGPEKTCTHHFVALSGFTLLTGLGYSEQSSYC